MTESNKPAVQADDGYTTVAVLEKFDMTRQIGEMRILTSAIPATPNFVFSLGYEALEFPGVPGAVGAAPYPNKYRLCAVAPQTDVEYVGYLRQTGLITDQADTAELRKAHFVEAMATLRNFHYQQDCGPMDASTVIDECIDELRSKIPAPTAPPRTIYQQAKMTKGIIEEAEEIMDIPGMLVDTAAWRRILGVLIAIAKGKAPLDPNKGWIRYEHGVTKLVDDREYFALRQTGTDLYGHVVRWDDDRNYGTPAPGNPGFVDINSGIQADDYLWYQEVSCPPSQQAKEPT